MISSISSTRFWLLCAGMLGSIFFSYYAVFVHGRLLITSDAAGYVDMAHWLVSGSGFVNPEQPIASGREPLFPLFLAGILSFAGSHMSIALGIQSGMVIAALVWFMRILIPYTGRVLAGVVVILTSLLPGVAATVAGNFLPETLASIFFLLAFGICTRLPISSRCYWHFALFGGVLAAAGLTRFPLLFLPIFLIVLWFIFRRRITLPFPAPKALGFLCAGFLLPVVLWTLYNYYTYGIFSPTGTKGGGEFLVRADKTHFYGKDLGAYLFGSLAGDYLGQKVYSQYAAVVEPRVYGTDIRYAYGRDISLSERPEEVNSRYIREGLRLVAAHPLRYVADGLAEIFKLNSPMLWHNAADIRHLFSGTHPEIPDWAKTSFLIAYQGIFYLGIGFAFYILFTEGFTQPWLFFPVMAMLYVNAIYFFFDSYPRYAMPIYPFYALFVVWGLRKLFRNNVSLAQ